MEMGRHKLSSSYFHHSEEGAAEHTPFERRVRKLTRFVLRELHSLASGPGSGTESGKGSEPMTDGIPFEKANKW